MVCIVIVAPAQRATAVYSKASEPHADAEPTADFVQCLCSFNFMLLNKNISFDFCAIIDYCSVSLQF